MKSILALILLLGILSCNNKNPVAGRWKIESIGTEDTASAHKNLLAFAMLTMLSSGAELEFSADGNYTFYNEGKPTPKAGKYILTKNKSLILISANERDSCDLILKSDHEILLKFTGNSSIIYLIKRPN